MKRYIRASKAFYGIKGERVELERETRSLIYEMTREGDYERGKYHKAVYFNDAEGNRYVIQKAYNPMTCVFVGCPYDIEQGKSYQVSGYFVPYLPWRDGKIMHWVYQPRILGVKAFK